jgi:phosphoserine phosphatase RsbU/P
MINELNGNQTYADLQAELVILRQTVADLQQEKSDLEVLLENLTDHATNVENELGEKNAQITRSFHEIERLREQEQKYIEGVRRELLIGRQIQSNFLPDDLPKAAGWELDARFKPAREVSGDFYDAFDLPGGRIGFLIADVCDKGVGAALFMALTRSLMRVLARSRAVIINQSVAAAVGNQGRLLVELPGDAKSPPLVLPADIAEVLSAVVNTNEYINENHSASNMFATLFFGVLDTSSGNVYYVNAGHDAPMHIGADGKLIERLTLTGPAVGMMPGVKYRIRKAELAPGDVLLVYTDGVPEARSPQGEFFSVERIIELLKNYVGQATPNAAGLISRLEDDLTAFVAGADPSDDITMLALRRAI